MYNIYVVELSKVVYSENWRFRSQNPQYNPRLECLYVGMTSLSPEARFAQHKSGGRSKKGHKLSSFFVERYGLYLRPSLYRNFNPLSRNAAFELEKKLALDLRRQRYAVWWN